LIKIKQKYEKLLFFEFSLELIDLIIAKHVMAIENYLVSNATVLEK